MKVLVIGDNNSVMNIKGKLVDWLAEDVICFVRGDVSDLSKQDLNEIKYELGSLFGSPLPTIKQLSDVFKGTQEPKRKILNQLPEKQTYQPKVNRKTKRW